MGIEKAGLKEKFKQVVRIDLVTDVCARVLGLLDQTDKLQMILQTDVEYCNAAAIDTRIAIERLGVDYLDHAGQAEAVSEGERGPIDEESRDQDCARDLFVYSEAEAAQIVNFYRLTAASDGVVEDKVRGGDKLLSSCPECLGHIARSGQAARR